MANDAPAESLSQKVERYFSLLILFIKCENMVGNVAFTLIPIRPQLKSGPLS